MSFLDDDTNEAHERRITRMPELEREVNEVLK